MNRILFLLPLLLVISIPTAFATETVASDYITIEDFTTGEAVFTSHPEKIQVGGELQNYVLTVNDQKVMFNSNTVGSLIYDKNSCSYSLYENGFDGANVIPSVSSVAIYLEDGVWQHLPVNDQSCEVEIFEIQMVRN